MNKFKTLYESEEYKTPKYEYFWTGGKDDKKIKNLIKGYAFLGRGGPALFKSNNKIEQELKKLGVTEFGDKNNMNDIINTREI